MFISQQRCQQVMLKVVQHHCLCRSSGFVCQMWIPALLPRAVGLSAASRHHWEPFRTETLLFFPFVRGAAQ